MSCCSVVVMTEKALDILFEYSPKWRPRKLEGAQ